MADLAERRYRVVEAEVGRRWAECAAGLPPDAVLIGVDPYRDWTHGVTELLFWSASWDVVPLDRPAPHLRGEG